MALGGRCLSLCLLGVLLGLDHGFDQNLRPCGNGIRISVILLNDEEFPWSLKYVKGEILRAIEKEADLNAAQNVSFEANFAGINTSIYKNAGCESSLCEGVAEVKMLSKSKMLGCAVLGPSCTLAMHQLVDSQSGLQNKRPFLSAGSFGLKCDGTKNLQRLLPPALKISSFFFKFWGEHIAFKPEWKKTYVYKNPQSSYNNEECFWYIDGLVAGDTKFANISKEVIRSPEDLKLAMAPNRTSNLYIMCGSPADVEEVKSRIPETDSADILFFLIDLYNDQYYLNESTSFMRNVLVLTMPETRSYIISNEPHNKMNDFMAAYHDAVLFIGNVSRTIAANAPQKRVDPYLNASLFRNTSFEGTAGTYRLDAEGDRDVTLSVVYTTSDLKYRMLFTFDTETSQTQVEDPDPDLVWGKRLPKDAPDRGPSLEEVLMTVLGVTVVVVTTIAFIFYRQNRKERRLRKAWSHIRSELVSPLEENELSVVTLRIENEAKKKNFKIRRAIYDKKIVTLKELKHSDGNFDETQRMELNRLLHIDYYNLTKFYGTVQLEQGVFGVFEYGERGSLKFVLNDKVSYPETFMDWEFKMSVMYDIAKGMSYLHNSDVQVHGRLKSTNCVVDNRMVVKITDFGCNTFLLPGRDLWTAPEHLRKEGTSQKGDVYSFSIIAQEIIYRRCTFFTESCSDRAEKLSRVQCPGVTVFRPDLELSNGDTSETETEVYALIRSCWDEDPERRPDFKKVENCLEKSISKIHNYDNESYMDNMIRRLQMYSKNLELLVEERTALYKRERDRADDLNYMLLPGPVVQSLKETGAVEPELFEEVTVYFSDIVGFTTLCQYSSPMEVVDLLNHIYQGFDRIVDLHQVYKVETIGDAYMVTSGLPQRNGNRHAVDICHMALDILTFMGTFQLRHLPGIPVWIRIGVHSGPCAAGVVGVKMPRYCLFGDTVNTASRLESTGHPLKIHVSRPTVDILSRTDTEFEFELRGDTFLKGKGAETTYWLTGEKGRSYDLPTPPTTENFQRLQQDLAHMIVECLEQNSQSAVLKRPLRRHSGSGPDTEPPEYLRLASVDNTLSTFL